MGLIPPELEPPRVIAMYDRILLPTDGSDGTERALEHALALAGTYDATLHVLSVIDDSSIGAATEPSLADLRSRRADAVEEIGDRARSADVAVETALREGSPHREILEYVDAAAIDMIVMGTHGRSGVGRVLLGSVAERIVRASPVPVVTVRMGADSEGVANGPAAERAAREALSAADYESIEIPEDPYRTTTAWVVPATTESGTFNVHVDAADGTTRIARLDR